MSLKSYFKTRFPIMIFYPKLRGTLMSLLRFLLTSLILLSTTLWAGVGKVALLKGEATLERGVQKIALQNGSALEEKDIIKTSKDAQVQLMFEDKTVITLGSESEFKIEEYLNDTANPKAKFKFNQGAFKTITGQIGKTAPENFTLETKTATIGIRGTIIAGNIPPPPPPNIPPLPEAIFCLGGTITVASIAVPNVVIVVPKGSFTQITTPNAPPAPPTIFTPADLQQINQNLGTTPPPPSSTSNTQSQNNNTPAATNSSEGSSEKTPTPTPPAQTVTPVAVGDALQTNTQTNKQATTISTIVTTIVEQTGASPEEVKNQILNQTCPSGTSGTYPNCVVQTCPTGTTGVYPNCVTLTCPTGTIGTYPNCVSQTCPSGTSGTYPNCIALTCPDGTTGIYPNCTLISPPSIPELPMTCPNGTVGTFPNCVVQTCPNGTSGTYPNCTQLPPALPDLPSVCPSGTSGTYPNCTPDTTSTITFALTGFATSSYYENGALIYNLDNPLAIIFINPSLAGGNLILKDSNGNSQQVYDLSLSQIVAASSSNAFELYNFGGLNEYIATENITLPNDYVSWGYWMNSSQDIHTWVAGKDALAAAQYLATLPVNSSYTYTGKVLGSVVDTGTLYGITDSANSVVLKFNFGSGANGLVSNESHINFTANNKLWSLSPSGGGTGGTFSGTLSNTATMDSSLGTATGSIKGQFFGNQAQAVGGTFNATTTNAHAIGVFKVVRP